MRGVKIKVSLNLFSLKCQGFAGSSEISSMSCLHYPLLFFTLHFCHSLLKVKCIPILTYLLPNCACVLDEETEKLNAELEDQYRLGLEMKMSGCARRHTGLGFSEPEPPAASETPSEAGTDVAECTDVDGDAGVPAIGAEKSSDEDRKPSEGREESSDNGSKCSDTKKPALAGFVQSSRS